MKKLLLAAALFAAGPSAQAALDQGNKPGAQQSPDAAQQSYDQQVRDAAAARQRYEADQAQYQRDLARNQAEVRRAQAAQADYDRRMARRQARIDARNARRSRSDSRGQAEAAVRDEPVPPGASTAVTEPVAVASEQCQEQQRRARGRGRAIGGVIGGVAGGVLGRGSTLQRLATVALAAPVGALIGDAIARHLDCHEQRQAAAATEQVVERGVGATQTWTSDTRPGVTGTSTVTAAAAPADDGNPCVTVTDVIIVDGQETRAPKRMCRRPPTNRFVRV
jgi:surface antigen